MDAILRLEFAFGMDKWSMADQASVCRATGDLLSTDRPQSRSARCFRIRVPVAWKGRKWPDYQSESSLFRCTSHWAIERVGQCREADRNRIASARGLTTRVFVNFNPRSIDDPVRGMASTLRAALSSGIAPESFVFEVVESDEIVDEEALLTILEFCREVGCRVALDDLGAGHSSLKLMTKIRPDFVKLDMTLIRDVDRDGYKSCVAGKIIELARELGAETVVDGVETDAEWRWDQGARRGLFTGIFVCSTRRRST